MAVYYTGLLDQYEVPHLQDGGPDMITGVHALIFTMDAERDRAFFRDVLEFPSVDAGDGWLIFGLPPAELAAHPAEQGGEHELYLMCDDVDATVAELKAKGVELARPIRDEGFGLVTAIRLPGGGELGLYQPRHPSPLSADPSTS
jgi:predicted enzyme related to lactoylglutathione lyase